MAYTTINKPTEHFTTTTWTGDNTSPKTFTTGTFKPDFLWGKDRDNAYSHQVYDTTRGAGNDKELTPNSNIAESAQNADQYGYVSAFTSTGFTATKGTESAGYDYWNRSADKYIGFSWKANGGTTSSNSDGDITSTVQANTTAGFSIVTWTSNGGNTATIGHGLGATPTHIIYKSRSSASGAWYNWINGSIDGSHDLMSLNTTGTKSNIDTSTYGSPSSTTISNFGFANNENMIAYCFVEKTGYSSFGSYTGNGSSNGTFIYLGFKPAFFMCKRHDSANNWTMYDNKRNNPFNEVTHTLIANGADAESSSTSDDDCDFLSNGVKMRCTNNGSNGSNAGYFYMAFAEAPLVGTNNIPCTAR
tara:strand:+ start:1735 stop:2814 length:1080 start_codon:yes stop_codon:yes gene_type:complete